MKPLATARLVILLLPFLVCIGAEDTPVLSLPIADVHIGSEGSAPEGQARYGDAVIASLLTEATGRELWVIEPWLGRARLLSEMVPDFGGKDRPITWTSRPDLDLIFASFQPPTRKPELWAGNLDGMAHIAEVNGQAIGNLADGILINAIDRGSVDTHSLWFSDGSTEGSQEIATFELANIERIRGVGSSATLDRSWFLVGRYADSTTGRGLWVSDGTAAGTQPVTSATTDEAPIVSHASRFHPHIEGNLYFLAHATAEDLEAESPTQLWRTPGSSAEPILELPEGEVFVDHIFTVFGDTLYFVVDTDAGPELRRYHSSSGAVDVVGSVGDSQTLARYIFSYDDAIWVSTSSSRGFNRTLWRMDTESLTITPFLEDHEAAGIFADNDHLALPNGLLVFNNDDLFLIGNDASVTPFESIIGRGIESSLYPTEDGRAVFFIRDPFSAPQETTLWITDGTHAGTQLLSDGPYRYKNPAVFGNRVLFWEEDPTLGVEPHVLTIDGSLILPRTISIEVSPAPGATLIHIENRDEQQALERDGNVFGPLEGGLDTRLRFSAGIAADG